jgi:hypothetical protein
VQTQVWREMLFWRDGDVTSARRLPGTSGAPTVAEPAARCGSIQRGTGSTPTCS